MSIVPIFLLGKLTLGEFRWDHYVHPHPSPHASLFFLPQSTLGFVGLVLSTLHTLTYGWTRAFEESRYKFYLPPTFTLTLLVPCVVILAKVLFLLPCFSRRLYKIRRGWEKEGAIKFTLPGDHALAQKTSHV